MVKTKKKNKALPIIVLLVLLCAFIIGYVLLLDYNEKNNAELEAEPENEATIEVLKKDKAILTSFSFTSGEDVLAFDYINSLWVYKADANYPIDTEAVDKAIAVLSDIKAVTELTSDGVDIADFGFDKPSFILTAKYSDDSEYTLTFGSINSFNSCQYMQITGSDVIYMVEASLASTFDKTLGSFYRDEVWELFNDSVSSSDVASVVVATADGRETVIEYPETVELLYNEIYKLDLNTWVDYYADESEMASSYGIRKTGDRVTVNYDKEVTSYDASGKEVKSIVRDSYTIYFGYDFENTDDENKEGFFYSPENSTVVYSEEKAVADKIFEYINYVPPVSTEAEE